MQNFRRKCEENVKNFTRKYEEFLEENMKKNISFKKLFILFSSVNLLKIFIRNFLKFLRIKFQKIVFSSKIF